MPDARVLTRVRTLLERDELTSRNRPVPEVSETKSQEVYRLYRLYAAVSRELGEAATEIDGEWYPVDVKGCYYPELFDSKLQENDPQIMELVEKINNEEAFTVEGLSIRQRHYGGYSQGFLNNGEAFPNIADKQVDAILFGQQLCFNPVTNQWEHTIDAVVPTDAKNMPEESRIVRAVVGWLDSDNNYSSFTYLQESVRNKDNGVRDLSGQKNEKAAKMKDAFELWRPLVTNAEQVGLAFSFSIAEGENVLLIDDVKFESYFRQLIQEAHIRRPDRWNETIQDPKFAEWVFSPDSQVRYMSNRLNQRKWIIDHRQLVWRWWGEQATKPIAEGGMPELVVRLVLVEKR